MEKDKQYYETQASESEFLDWYKKQDLPNYEKPSVTVDMIMIRWNPDIQCPQFLAIKRKNNPFRNKLALPGGFINPEESSEDAVLREVKEETGLSLSRNDIEQLKTVTTPNRDPRGWTITVAYLVFIPFYSSQVAVAGDDASEIVWVNARSTNAFDTDPFEYEFSYGENDIITESEFAFDHYDIIQDGFLRIANKLNYLPNILDILPKPFTLKTARLLFRELDYSGHQKMDNSNFYKMYGKFLMEIGIQEHDGAGRPAKTFEYVPYYK